MMETKISTGTVIRTALLALALINLVLSVMGYPVLPIEDAQLEDFISNGAVIVMALIGFWKNNSFTKAAIQGDIVMKDIKQQSTEVVK